MRNEGRSSRHIKVAAILGPTAVGKSRIAVEVARNLEAEIISVDSMQVYRGMDIGTAKPGHELREAIPHHMIDVVNPDEEYSVARFQLEARRAVEEVASRGKVPLLVGGTGLYFEAVVYDLRFPPGGEENGLREELEEWARRDLEGLRARLREVDPEFASRSDFSNPRRVIRAMEVYMRTGVPISRLQSRRGEQPLVYPYVGVVLDAPRQALYRAIDRRVEEMFSAGLVEEVRSLAERGLSRTARQALGYKEVLSYLDSRKTLGETISEIKRRSRRYAKRQLTWFRRLPGLRWLRLEESELLRSSPESWKRVFECLREGLDGGD
ncbi:tRNA (adenosine(37)-N6)-dimethylallyltransferase MiaA [Candidatus Solincola tengchongensis]|uniref:tRNA (adenosine(37)-N6)-dimethylallyltransferase MiaA n=1 Tax=Candidatus Solincola tengchongensis TaxID=2900693 RepID=UPI00257DDE8D|nr:tRNA (adenosine(37)-N6)-dimethylallyltransferase MiaA [Candidatus Solincola tengchongensis]